MIINIGTKLDLLEAELSNEANLINIFGDRIYIGKPISPKNGKTLYINLESNSELIGSDNNSKSIYKRANFDFVIYADSKNTADVELYEDLDKIVNTICFKNYNLNGFKILGILESNQSGVMYDKKERPFIIAQFIIDYQSIY